MKTIQLSRGMLALVDDRDHEWLSAFKWTAAERDGAFYATTHMPVPAGFKGKSKKVPRYMHRLLMSPDAKLEVDHRDGNGLNNQRKNLRVVTHRRNMQAKRIKRKKRSSRYRGVTWHKGRKTWQAQIKPVIDGRPSYRFLGNFHSEVAAAAEYDRNAKIFGFPNEALNKVA